MRSWLTTLGGLLAATTAGVAGQNEVGEDICACSASTYEFTFDFSLFCPPVNITISDAVSATACQVNPFGDPSVTDLVPVAVQSIDILELGQDLSVLVQENIAGNFGDGDSFRYTSVAANPDAIGGYLDIPRAIQINVVGVNVRDEPIINIYIITFSNDCGAYPVLFEGQYAGWTRFTDIGPPRKEVCPLFGVGDPPTGELTTAPTKAPLPTNPPVDAPVDMSMSMGVYDMDGLVDMAEEFGGMRKKDKKGGKDKAPKLKASKKASSKKDGKKRARE